MDTHIDGPAIVIGDLHGQDDQFVRLLSRLRREVRDFEEHWIVLLGDLVDRGPNPRATLGAVIDLIERHPKTTIVCGNHEWEMSRALGSNPTRNQPASKLAWLRGYGAEATFASYGARFGDLEELRRRIPASHRELITDLPWCVEHPRYIFVHAGLDPDLPWAMQRRVLRRRDLVGGRIPWLCSTRFARADPPQDCQRCVVSGHLLVPHVVLRKRRMLLGTTDGISGQVSAVVLPERRVIPATGHVERR